MRAFILAAGLGVRMGALGESVPKALLPLGGVPMIRFALDRLCRAGVTEAIVNIHHRADVIRAELGDHSCGVNVSYSHEPEILGTAGGIKKAEMFLRGSGEPFFVINVDIVSGADLGEAMASHREGGFLATLILRKSPDAKRFGLLAADETGRLRSFLRAKAPGDPAGPLTEAMFTGQSILSPDFLDHIPAGRACGISEEVYPPLIEGGALIGSFLTDAYWADVGTPGRYLDAVHDLLAGRFVPELEWPGEGAVLALGPPFDWGGGRICPPVLIGRGAELKRGSSAGPFAVLGGGAILAEGASVKESVLFPEAEVGENESLERCVVGVGALASTPDGSLCFESVFLNGQRSPISF